MNLFNIENQSQKDFSSYKFLFKKFKKFYKKIFHLTKFPAWRSFTLRLKKYINEA